MNYIKKVLLFFLLPLAFPAVAQLNFYVEGTGNISLISGSKATSTSEIESDNPSYSLRQKETYRADYSGRLGGGVAAGLSYFMAENFSLDVGLDFTAANFFQRLNTDTEFSYSSKINSEQSFPDPPEPFYTKKDDSHSLGLLSLPISVSYYLQENNLAVGVGILPSLLLYSTGGTGASTDFNKTAFGLQIQLRYQIVPQLWLVAGLKEYSTKLYDAELKQSFSSLRLLKLGLRYDI